MIKTETKLIQGREFLCTQFPARLGVKNQARLVKNVGPIIGDLASALVDKKATDHLSKALSGLAGVDPDAFAALAFDLLASTRIDNKEITESVFDMEFAGNYDLLYAALAFVIQHNYGSLFRMGGIGLQLAARLSQPPAPQVASPKA